MNPPNWWLHNSASWSDILTAFQVKNITCQENLLNSDNWHQLSEGESNANYRLTYNGLDYFVQIALPKNQIKLPNTLNKTIHQVLKQSNLKHWLVHCYFETANIKIFDWINATSLETSQLDNAIIKKIINFLLTLHSSQLKFPQVDLSDHCFRYFAMAKSQVTNDLAGIKSIYQEAKSLLQNYTPCVPCHNDLSPTNLLHNGALYVVDWEYATIGDPLFDLAGLANNFELSESQSKLLFSDYYYSAKPIHQLSETQFYRKLDCMRQLNQKLSLLWYAAG